MPKSFKEFSTGGFAMGSIDSVTPVVSLGPTDRPPESAKRRGDTRMIGLKVANQSPFKKKIIDKLKKPLQQQLQQLIKELQRKLERQLKIILPKQQLQRVNQLLVQVVLLVQNLY